MRNQKQEKSCFSSTTIQEFLMEDRPSDMYQDMKKLNMLYEEMCWDNDDILEFYPDYENNTIIIRNKTMDEDMISG